MNLLKVLQDQLGGELMGQAASFLGESSKNTSSAMGAALPTILGSLISKGSSQSGASGIMDMISKGGFDGSMLSNLGSMFGGGDATSGLMNSGGGILKSLMGDKLGGVVDMIASMSGMKKKSSSSLLSMAAPMIMSMIGKKVMGDKMGAGGLMKFLGSQAGFVKDALPSGISDLMGFGNLGSTVSETVGAAANTAADAAKGGGGILKWLLLGALALLALGYFGFKTGCNAVDSAADTVTNVTTGAVEGAGDLAGAAASTVGDAASTVGDAVGDAAGAAGDLIKEGAAAAADFANKALEGVTFAAGSAGESLKGIFSGGGDIVGKTVTFKTMNFATGKSEVPAGAMSEVNNLAALLNAYPSATVEIGGYTDNVGNAANNVALSGKRAESIKKALVGAGIDDSRITTKGYGDANPVGDNSTKDGQAANRRIEVKVTKG